MATAAQDNDEMITSINVTPLVDITLVLLVILMITASYVASKAIPLDLPKGATAETTPVTLSVSIDKDGKTYLEAAPIDDAGLRAKVRAARASDPETRAVIAADGRAAHSHVVHVMDLLRREEVTKFAINVDPEDVGPLSLTLSPLRGARGPDGDDVATPFTAELAANDNAADAANDNATAARGAIPTELEMQNVTREIALEEDEAATGWRGLALLLLVSVAAHAAAVRRSRRHLASRRGEAAQAAADRDDGDREAAAARAATARGEAGAQGGAQKIAARAPAPPPPDAPPPPPPEAETPADFSGTTLTNDGPGDGWASAVGNGEAMRGPIGRPGAKVTGRARDGAAEPSPAKAAPVVALASLSRPPAPPDLNDALERHYPEAARKQGTPGQAVLKARITAEGQVRDWSSCRRARPGSATPAARRCASRPGAAPLDRDGQPVATFISYTCRFEVR